MSLRNFLGIVFVILVFDVSAVHAQSNDSKLSLDEADDMARHRLLSQLRGDSSASGTPPLPMTLTNSPSPVAAGVDMVAKPANEKHHETVDPVTFVGAYSDGNHTTVLYDYNGAIYPGEEGSKLLNGWKVESVNGFKVSVSNGGKSWTVPIVNGAPEKPAYSAGADALATINSITSLGGQLTPALTPRSGRDQPVVMPLLSGRPTGNGNSGVGGN